MRARTPPLTQVALAKRMGVDQPALNRRLTGKYQFQIDELPRLAKALEVSLSELLFSAGIVPDRRQGERRKADRRGQGGDRDRGEGEGKGEGAGDEREGG